MMPRPELLRQLARLVGYDVFTDHFGPIDAADPDAAALRALIDERCDYIATVLVEEAAASDDVTSPESAQAYVDDRLRMLEPVLTKEQAEALLAAFTGKTSGW
ncbi:MAG TPA: hypothetical protein VIH21_07475 [Dehalococcoidia bacterium]